MNIQVFTFNDFFENTFVVFDENRNAIIIDPGNFSKSENEKLLDFITKKELVVSGIYSTHCHIDHIFGVDFLKAELGVEWVIPEGEVENLRAQANFAPMFGIHNLQTPEFNRTINQNDTIGLGAHQFKIFKVAGHAPGHLVFYQPESKMLIAGDVLFKGSIGRTDLPFSEHEVFVPNIFKMMENLPDDVIVFSGHGPYTTIGDERLNNPFLQ